MDQLTTGCDTSIKLAQRIETALCPTYTHIVKALLDLNIDRGIARKIKGLRVVVYQYILHGDFISAHRQLTVPKYQQGNRRLAKHLPEHYHKVFNRAIEDYAIES